MLYKHCRIKDCKNLAEGLGLCNTHYKRDYRKRKKFERDAMVMRNENGN
jgi:hypothetical protein